MSWNSYYLLFHNCIPDFKALLRANRDRSVLKRQAQHAQIVQVCLTSYQGPCQTLIDTVYTWTSVSVKNNDLGSRAHNVCGTPLPALTTFQYHATKGTSFWLKSCVWIFTHSSDDAWDHNFHFNRGRWHGDIAFVALFADWCVLCRSFALFSRCCAFSFCLYVKPTSKLISLPASVPWWRR